MKLADSKMGPRIVWLGQAARSVLDRFTRGESDERVFPFNVQPESAIDWFWRYVSRRAGLEDVRLHDLRHNYASLAARSSETLPMIGTLLGHKDVRTTVRYAHLDDAIFLCATEAVGAEIEQHLATGQTTTTNGN